MYKITSVDEYNAIAERRRNLNRQVFEIHELITLEYLDRHEWEFTLHTEDSAERKKYLPCDLQMTDFFQNSKRNSRNLYPLIVVCKRIAEDYFKVIA